MAHEAQCIGARAGGNPVQKIKLCAAWSPCQKFNAGIGSIEAFVLLGKRTKGTTDDREQPPSDRKQA